MTFEVQQTRWDRTIRRVSGSIGPGSRLGETLGELFPTMDVELVPGELLALGGTKLCCGMAESNNIAAQTSRVQLFNPLDSGNIITVTHVSVFAETVLVFINHAVRQIALANDTSFNRFRDGRFPTPNRPVGQIRIENSVAQTDPDQQFSVNNTVTRFLEDVNGLAVLPPGSGYEFGTGSNNIAVSVSFRWRERPAEESELSLGG